MRGTTASLLISATALVLTLSSCTENPGTADDGDQPTSAPAPEDSPGSDSDSGSSDPMPATVDETQEMVSERLSSWQNYEVVSNTELQFAFYSGNPACYGVRSVLEEDADQVRVATISGTLLEAVDSACTQEARYVSLAVELDEPLGDREVVPLHEVELRR